MVVIEFKTLELMFEGRSVLNVSSVKTLDP